METFEAIMRRHGVLSYRNTPVEPDKIERVLRAAVAAPSPANTQPWAFVVVIDAELVRQVAEHLVRAQEKLVFGRVLEAPGPFIAQLMRLYDGLANVPCFIILCRQQRVDLAPEEFSAVVRDWDLCSLGAAMENLMVAAADLDLGTRWFGSPMIDDGGSQLHQILRIPDRVEIVAVTPLGYHDEPPKERPVQSMELLSGFRRGDKASLAALLDGKLALDEVVHFDRFDGAEGEGR